MTQWHRRSERPLLDSDVGKIIVARDRFGAPITGTLERDGFGLLIVHAAIGADEQRSPVDRVVLYIRVDPPRTEEAGGRGESRTRSDAETHEF